MNTKNIFRMLLVAATLLLGANNVKAEAIKLWNNGSSSSITIAASAFSNYTQGTLYVYTNSGQQLYIGTGETENDGDPLFFTPNNTWIRNYEYYNSENHRFEFTLTSEMVTKIKTNGNLHLQNYSTDITLVEFIPGEGTSDPGTSTENKHYLTFKTSEWCAADWRNNTFSWGPDYKGWGYYLNFIEVDGISEGDDLSDWTHLHMHVSNWNNVITQHLRVVFKSDHRDGPTKEFVVSPNASGNIDIELGEWGNCDITNIYDLTIYSSTTDDTNQNRADPNQNASVMITDAYYTTGSAPETETVTIGTTGCITYSNPNSSINFDNVSGLNAYIASAVDLEQNLVTLTQVSGTVAANTGLVLIRESGNTETSFSLPLSSSTGTTYSNNLLVASTEKLTLWHTNTSYTYYVLVQRGNVAKFAEVYSDDAELDAGKAYLRINKVNNARTRGLSIVFSDGTTGISSIENKSDVNVIYNLCGQRVDNPTKGIYIVNGKKVLMK